MIEVENRTKENDGREQDDHRTDDPVDNGNACLVESPADFVHKPRQSVPPKERAQRNTDESDGGFEGPRGLHKSKLCERGHEEKDNQRVGKGDEKRRQPIMKECAFATILGMGMHFFGRIGAETEYAKEQQNDTSGNLKEKLILRILQWLHDKPHAQADYQRIDDVAQCRADTSHHAIPAAFVQSALDAKDSYGTHRSRCDDADGYPLKDEVEDIELNGKVYIHNSSAKFGKIWHINKFDT